MTATESTEIAPFDPPLALASLSGESDAAWARAGAEYAGAAFLGGIAIDEPTREAARQMASRDRSEFLPPDPVAFIDDQLTQLSSVPLTPGFNVRTTTHGPLERVAEVCRAHNGVLEINAHCRQEEMCATGAGQALLTDSERLCTQVSTAAAVGVPISVKIRTEVPGVDLPALAALLETAGASMLHVDAMDSERVIAEVVDRTTIPIIANNEVRGRQSVHEYLSHGAAAVSVGRPSDDPAVLERVSRAIEQFDHASTTEGFS